MKLVLDIIKLVLDNVKLGFRHYKTSFNSHKISFNSHKISFNSHKVSFRRHTISFTPLKLVLKEIGNSFSFTNSNITSWTMWQEVEKRDFFFLPFSLGRWLDSQILLESIIHFGWWPIKERGGEYRSDKKYRKLCRNRYHWSLIACVEDCSACCIDEDASDHFLNDFLH